MDANGIDGIPDPRTLLIRSFRRHLDDLEALERKPEGGEEFVHQLRTGSKRLRAFWRLARSSLSGCRLREELRSLKDASRSLAAARERTAILNALRRLEAHGRGNPATGDGKGAEAAHASTLERFEARVPPVPKGTANRAHAALTELAESLRRLEGLAPPALDRDSVRDAFERCYRRSRKAYRKTDRNAGRSFHVLRKRIKDLWYQLEALRPESEEPQTLKPGGPRKYRGRLDTLQDKLGEMQDLAILEARTRNNPEEFGSAGTIREIEAALKAERKRLERKTLRLGAKALDRKAKSVSRKMGLRKAR